MSHMALDLPLRRTLACANRPSLRPARTTRLGTQVRGRAALHQFAEARRGPGANHAPLYHTALLLRRLTQQTERCGTSETEEQHSTAHQSRTLQAVNAGYSENHQDPGGRCWVLTAPGQGLLTAVRAAFAAS
jgi:hypothetical protein